MLFIELFNSHEVNNMAISIDKPPLFVNESSNFVYEISISVLLYDWRFRLPIKIEVSSQLKRIKVVFLNTEGCWDLSSFIDFILFEHFLLQMLLYNVSCIWIKKISSFINSSSKFVHKIAIFILQNYDVPLLISIKLSKNIIFIKGLFVSNRRYLNNRILL